MDTVVKILLAAARPAASRAGTGTGASRTGAGASAASHTAAAVVVVGIAAAVTAAITVSTLAPCKLVAEVAGADNNQEYNRTVNAAFPAAVSIWLGPVHKMGGVKIADMVVDSHIPLFPR